MRVWPPALGRHLWRKGPEGTAERWPEFLCAGENAEAHLACRCSLSVCSGNSALRASTSIRARDSKQVNI